MHGRKWKRGNTVETAIHAPSGHPETMKGSTTITPLFQKGAGEILRAAFELFKPDSQPLYNSLTKHSVRRLGARENRNSDRFQTLLAAGFFSNDKGLGRVFERRSFLFQ